MKRAFLTSCLVLQAVAGSLSAYEEGPYSSRITVRHIEPNGIGYTQGYTTLEGFFAPGDFYRGCWLPYLDLRGHVFDHGNLAANAGFGLRYLDERHVWGVNAYYDYRNTHRLHYNQAALGFEVLGEKWDFRINGYLPVGKKRSHGFSLKFDHFAGHSLFLSRKHEYALAAVDGEVGYHVNRIEWLPVEVAAGPYYLRGNGQTAWGGKLRAAFDFGQYFRLEGNASYDNLFKWIGQGQASIIIPFGHKKRWICRKESEQIPEAKPVDRRKASRFRRRWAPRKTQENVSEEYCEEGGPGCLCKTLVKRAYQRVIRSEIVPVDTRRKTQVAIDPTTGAPYFFVFVDNLSGSDGTIEDPYATLAAAQTNSSPHDIVYVFTGNGTATGMNSGIVLKDFQQLLGSSVTHPIATTEGVISIPAFTLTLPVIGNTGGDVVAVANGNTISGLAINNLNGSGISQSNSGVTITNLTITNNTISSSSAVSRIGINLNNVTGRMVINQNEIGIEQSGGLALINANINNANYTITNNSIVTRDTGSGVPIALTYTNSSGITTEIANNKIEDSGVVSNPSLISVSASNSTAPASAHSVAINSNILSGGNGVSIVLTNAAQMSATLVSNDFSIRAVSSVTITGANTSSVTCLIKNNNIFRGISSSSTANISLNLTNSASGNYTIDNNTITTFGSSIFFGITGISLICDNSASATYSISNNNFQMHDTGGGTALSIASTGSSHTSGSILDNTINVGSANHCIGFFTSSTQLSICNIANNSFWNDGGSDCINITSDGGGRYNASVINNQLHQAITTGLTVLMGGGSVGRMQVNDNQFFGNGTEAALITTTGANTSLCLQFNNNTATPTQYANGTNPFIFTNTAPALFRLETPATSNNQGYFTLTNITSVPPNTCE